MQSHILATVLGSLVLGASLASAHCKISNAVGDSGGRAVAFGISAKAGDANGQGDVTKFGGSKFGQTGQGGAIDPPADLAAVQAISGETLPQVTAGGQLSMTLHQVNVCVSILSVSIISQGQAPKPTHADNETG